MPGTRGRPEHVGQASRFLANLLRRGWRRETASAGDMSASRDLFPLEAVSATFPKNVDTRLTNHSLPSSVYTSFCQLVRRRNHRTFIALNRL